MADDKAALLLHASVTVMVMATQELMHAIAELTPNKDVAYTALRDRIYGRVADWHAAYRSSRRPDLPYADAMERQTHEILEMIFDRQMPGDLTPRGG